MLKKNPKTVTLELRNPEQMLLMSYHSWKAQVFCKKSWILRIVCNFFLPGGNLVV